MSSKCSKCIYLTVSATIAPCNKCLLDRSKPLWVSFHDKLVPKQQEENEPYPVTLIETSL